MRVWLLSLEMSVRFYVVKSHVNTYFFAFKEDFSPVVCILCCDMLPGLHMGSQLFSTAEAGSLSSTHSLHAAT